MEVGRVQLNPKWMTESGDVVSSTGPSFASFAAERSMVLKNS